MVECEYLNSKRIYKFETFNISFRKNICINLFYKDDSSTNHFYINKKIIRV